MDFQGTLFEPPAPGLRSLAGTERHPLSRGAWVDVRRDFVSGADEVLERLVAHLPWRCAAARGAARRRVRRLCRAPPLRPPRGGGGAAPPSAARRRTRRTLGALPPRA